MKKRSRATALGIALADVVIETAHMTYNAPRGKKIVEACIRRLKERIIELQPKKANPTYKKARYGSSKKAEP